MFINEREVSPYYHQVKNDILAKIERGDYREGAKIDSEITLSRMYGVSRPTIRRAIEELVYAGRLWRKQGKGTFVSALRIHKNLNDYTPFAEDIKTIGKRMRLKILMNKRIVANAEIAPKISLAAGDEALKVVAIRMVENLPMLYRISYYPTDILPNLQQEINENTSMFDAIHRTLGEASGLHIARATQTFRVVLAKEPETRYLKLPPGAPLIQWEGINYLNTGRAIEYFYALANSESYIFSVEQTRR